MIRSTFLGVAIDPKLLSGSSLPQSDVTGGSLEPGTAAAVTPEETADVNQRHGARLLSIGLLLSLGACQAGAAPARSPVTPAATSSAKPLGEHVVAEWTVFSPAGIYIGTDSVWVPEHGGGRTTRIDPASNKVIGVVSSASAERAPDAQAFGSVWITTLDNKVDRVDPATKHVIASIVLEAGSLDILNGIVGTIGAVWVWQSDKAELIRIDPATNHIESRTPLTTLIAEAKAQTKVPAGKGSSFMWLQIVGDEGEGGGAKGLLRLDLHSGVGLTFLPWAPDQDGDGHLTVTDEAVWYGAGGHIYRIDVATNRIVATYPTATGIIHLAIGFGSVWLSNYERSLVQRLDVAL